MRRYHVPLSILLIVGILHIATQAHAQSLFEDSRNAFQNPEIALSENGGTLRGGANFSPFLSQNRSTTIFRGSARTESICGFDVFASFVEEFEKLPGQLMELAPAILAGVGITQLCQTFPSACDVIKHLHQWINVALRARFAQCQEIILASMNQGVAMRADAQGECMRREQAAGATLNTAWETCVQGSSIIPGPNDFVGAEFGIIAKALETVGRPPEEIARVVAVTGDITLSTDGSTFSRIGAKPNEVIMQRYVERKEILAEDIATTVGDMAAGAPPDPVMLRTLSVPGLPMPSDVLEGIVIEPDPAIRDFEIQKLAGAIALAQVAWDISEISKTLANTTQVSSLQPTQRDALIQTYNDLVNEKNRLIELKETQEKHVISTMDALLEKRAMRTAEAEQIARNAPSNEPLPSRFPETGQSSFGYRQ